MRRKSEGGIDTLKYFEMIKNIVYFNNQLEAASERGLACIHMKRGLTPLWKPQRNPKIHVSTGEEP